MLFRLCPVLVLSGRKSQKRRVEQEVWSAATEYLPSEEVVWFQPLVVALAIHVQDAFMEVSVTVHQRQSLETGHLVDHILDQ
jgi:hypothetical protein